MRPAQRLNGYYSFCARVLVLMVGLTTPALAGTVKLSKPFSNPTGGGPFDATVLSPIPELSGPTTFRTFCLEKGESFTVGTTYEVIVSDRAKYGTNGSSGGTDILNSTTAYLYSHFRAGDLASLLLAHNGGVFDPTNSSHLYKLQDVIWKYEGESVSFSISSLQAKLKDLADDNADGSLYNVRVMQLWDVGHANEYGHQRQDQLILVPTPQTATAGSLLLVGVVSATVARRRQAGVVVGT